MKNILSTSSNSRSFSATKFSGLRLSDLLRSGNFYLLVTLFTGSCGLIYQVVWQRYLGLLVGSEARSTSLVIALFLFGLAIGYFFWGSLTRNVTNKNKLLKTYGYLEIGIGGIGILFSSLFYKVLSLSYILPSHFIFDLLLCFILVVPPTFLMGATVPMLTSVLPKNESQINTFHAKIYGINTIGAFLGVLIASLYLIPTFGLGLTSTFTGLLNVLVGGLFWVNRFEGNIVKTLPIPEIKNNYHKHAPFVFAFVTGIVSISVEVLWIRLWSLTGGSHYLVFPMVLSLFVLGLGYGSLTLKQVNIKTMYCELSKAIIFLFIGFFLVSYLPFHLNNIRVSLTNIEQNQYLFYILSYCLLALVVLPFVISLGRLLPISYSILKKDQKNFGFQCGLMYFINTIGTFLGATVVAHLLLYAFNLEQVFKINIVILVALLCYFAFKDNKKKLVLLVSLTTIIFVSVAKWQRSTHALGVFRTKNYKVGQNFMGLFTIPKAFRELNVVKLVDGPNATSALIQFSRNHFSVTSNGKSDGHTGADFPTMSFAGLIPYLFAAKEKDLNVSVVGLGTGITAGLMGRFKDVKKVTVSEISRSMIELAGPLKDHNYNLIEQNKVFIKEEDAFKFFNRQQEKFDLVVSEPSNIWVVGVENLFTKYFYESVTKSMAKDGVFLQWFHAYSINNHLMNLIIKNISRSFKYVKMYKLFGGHDFALVASHEPLKSSEYFDRRMNEDVIIDVFKKTKTPQHENFLDVVELYNEKDMAFLGNSIADVSHSVEQPLLSFYALKEFFLGGRGNVNQVISPFVSRFLHKDFNTQRIDSIVSQIEEYSDSDHICHQESNYEKLGFGISPYCSSLQRFKEELDLFQNSNSVNDRIGAYKFLRKERLLNKDLSFLNSTKDKVLSYYSRSNTIADTKLIKAIVAEYIKEGDFEFANQTIRQVQNLGVFPAKEITSFVDDANRLMSNVKTLLNSN